MLTLTLVRSDYYFSIAFAISACREIEKGKYARSDVFANFEVIVEKREVLLLSDHRVIYCEKNDLFGGWQVSYQTNDPKYSSFFR